MDMCDCMHDEASAPVQELLENLERQAGRPDDTPHSIQSSRSGADRVLPSPLSSGTGVLSIVSYRRVSEG